MPALPLPLFQAALRDAKIPAALITNFDDGVVNPNFLYLTSYDGFGCLFVPVNGRAVLSVPTMELARAKRSGYAVRKFTEDVLKRKARILGIDFPHTNLELSRKLRRYARKLLNVTPILERLRMQKSPAELKALAKACQISDTIYVATFRNFKKFKTERDVANFMNAEAAKRGVSPSFDTIVAAGPNAAVPHHKPTNAKLRGFVVIDFGIKVHGYCSDTTRTVYVGKPSATQRALYALVLRAQEAAIAYTQYDRRCAKIHETAANLLGKYKKFFTHSLGHGVGLEIHEAPALGLHSKHLLHDSSPFTIEPGIYLPGKLGIRIEDTLVLQRGKPVLLTQFPRALVVR